MPEFLGSVGGAAFVATVAILARRAAFGTITLHETVGKEHPALFTVELRSRLGSNGSGLLHRRINALRKHLVFR